MFGPPLTVEVALTRLAVWIREPAGRADHGHVSVSRTTPKSIAVVAVKDAPGAGVELADGPVAVHDLRSALTGEVGGGAQPHLPVGHRLYGVLSTLQVGSDEVGHRPGTALPKPGMATAVASSAAEIPPIIRCFTGWLSLVGWLVGWCRWCRWCRWSVHGGQDLGHQATARRRQVSSVPSPAKA